MPDPIPLAQAHCIPCKGREHRPGSARRAELLPQVPGWPLGENGQALLRTFHFPDYRHTIAFVNALARIAHREDHHPDLSVDCGRCEVCYSTHDLGSLSANDFICAARAGALVD